MDNTSALIKGLPEDQRQILYKELGELSKQTEEREIPSSEHGAFLGLSYDLGGVEVKPLTLGALACLDYLNNPIVSDHADEVQVWEIWEFYFILCNQDQILPKMYRYARAKRAIDKTRDIADKSPEFYQKYLEALNSNEQRYLDEWDKSLEEFAQIFDGIDYQEMINLAGTIVSDAIQIYADRQADFGSDDDTKKKMIK